MLYDTTQLNWATTPIHVRIDDKEFIGLDVRDFEVVEERLRSVQMLLALMKALVPDLERRIDKVQTGSLWQRIQKLMSQTGGVAQDAPKRPSQAAIEQAKKNLELGKFTSLADFKKHVAVADIRTAREQAGLTQRVLAKKAGLTQPQLSRLEKDPMSASTTTLRKLASVLDIGLTL